MPVMKYRAQDGTVYPIAHGPKGDKGDTGPQGPQGDPGEVTQAELNAVESAKVNRAGDTMTGRLDIAPSAGVAYLRLKDAPVGVPNARQLIIQAHSGGGVSLVVQTDANTTPDSVYLRLRADGRLQFLRTSNDLTNGSVETGNGVRFKQNEAPIEAGNLARLARTPDPTTGDLGLPGYAGSDTGRRDVSGLLVNGWAGFVHIRRYGSQVALIATGSVDNRFTNASATGRTFINLPLGFRAALPGNYGVVSPYTSLTQALPMAVCEDSSNGLRFRYSGSDVIDSPALSEYGHIASWVTEDSWPTSLPGTQVTPPAQWT